MEFTYEEANKRSPLETYEWDNIWWDHPERSEKRVLLIGDSISCGYRRMVNTCLEEKMFADGYGTAKAVDNPKFMDGVRYAASQQLRCDLVHFNNGLHGWHLSDEEYETAYETLLEEIRKCFGDVPLIIGLTTPLRDAEDLSKFAPRNEIVSKRNEIARMIAARLGVQVNDLYAPLEHSPQFFLGDGVHLNEDGYRMLAEQIAGVIRSAL